MARLNPREARIEHIKRNAHDSWSFEGFGGSSVRHETLVFFDPCDRGEGGGEVRIPVYPSAWNGIEDVEREYGCTAYRCSCEAWPE